MSAEAGYRVCVHLAKLMCVSLCVVRLRKLRCFVHCASVYRCVPAVLALVVTDVHRCVGWCARAYTCCGSHRWFVVFTVDLLRHACVPSYAWGCPCDTRVCPCDAGVHAGSVLPPVAYCVTAENPVSAQALVTATVLVDAYQLCFYRLLDLLPSASFSCLLPGL